MSDLQKTLEQAAGEGVLLDSSLKNILALLKSGDNPIYRSSIEELAAAQAWAELNDRFFKSLGLGTGGDSGALHRASHNRGGARQESRA
jgi:phosphoglucomutase